MNLVFAFALNNENQFENCHFGDSHKFAIYQQTGDSIELLTEINNKYRGEKHGDNKKGNSIIKYLEGYNVNVLVSREFGKNIIMINKHFIPVIISKESPDDVIKILHGKLHWIIEEWNTSSSDYKLFRIKSSILKLKIEDK